MTYETETMGPHFEKIHLHVPGRPVIHLLGEVDTGDPHDHPFAIDSMIVFGGYTEEVYADDGSMTLQTWKRGDKLHIPAGKIHRIVELPEGECVTVAIYHEREREVGFYRWEHGQMFRRALGSTEFEPVP